MKKLLKLAIKAVLTLTICIALVLMVGEAPGIWQLVLTLGCAGIIALCGYILNEMGTFNN